MITKKIRVYGIVQGVGFRPFIWLAAEKLKLCGNVANTTGGVIIKVNSGSELEILQFMEYIKKINPQVVIIDSYLSQLGDTFLDGIRRSVNRWSFVENANSVRIIPVTLGEEVVAVGVASLVIESALANI